MTVGAGDKTLNTVEAFKMALANGATPREAVAIISDISGEPRDRIRSRLRRQGLWGDYDFDKSFGRVRAGIRDADYGADRIIPPNPPVDRDPCPRCGVRHDVGCQHSRQRLGMVL